MGESQVLSAAWWVTKLVAEEIQYLGGVRDKVESLSTELTGIANFLTDSTSGSRPRNDTLKGIISQARNLAYDCEDAIETYLVVVQHKFDEYEGFMGPILRFSCLLSKAVPAHRIGTKIDSINSRISALQNQITSYLQNTPGPSDGSRNTDLQKVYSHEKLQFVVVGFGRYLEALRKSLLDKNDKRVILICGMGGIGKSTLAKQLHSMIGKSNFFDSTGWAQATHEFDPKQVVETLLYSLAPKHDSRVTTEIEKAISNNRAYGALYEQMDEKEKCLVIIDDIWDPRDWENISSALPVQSEKGSRIVLTSRNSNILPQDWDDRQKLIQNVTSLDETSSWDLFEQIAFPHPTCADPEKKEFGKEMLKQCNGVPLAIVVLAKVLKRKERVKDWERMHTNILRSIASGGSADVISTEVYKVLRVSYDEMPSHLKPCFLHLANFLQGYEISAQKLYQVWVGEGIVIKNGYTNNDEKEEDIAEKYLEELARRNMVQVTNWAGDRIRTFRLHDLMRDVCIQIGKEENYVKIIDVKGPKNHTKRGKWLRRLAVYMDQIDFRLRRLAVYMDHNDFIKIITKKARNLRALLVFPIGEQSDYKMNCQDLIKVMVESYPLLRVFDCANVSGISGRVPDKVKKMIHLKYLGLANTRVSQLPRSIHKLRWLQTLDVQVDKDVVFSLPNVLWMMKRLRHVYLPHYGELSLRDIGRVADAPDRYLIIGGEMLRLDGLTDLQTVMNLDLDRLNPEGLSDLESLRRLSAVCKTVENINVLAHFVNCESLEAFNLRLHVRVLVENHMLLSPSTSIDELDIYAEPYSKLRFASSLNVEMFPRNLTTLRLLYLQLRDDPFPVLEKLPNLDYLGLVLCYDECKRLVCSANGFPKLTMIYLDALGNLEHWEVQQGALPNLKTLLIINCLKLTIPEAFDNITDRTIFNEDVCTTQPPEASTNTWP